MKRAREENRVEKRERKGGNGVEKRERDEMGLKSEKEREGKWD